MYKKRNGKKIKCWTDQGITLLMTGIFGAFFLMPIAYYSL